jgi:putative hydrolase of the HAD superfamily
VTVLLLDVDGVLLHPPGSLEADLAAAAPWGPGGHAAFAADLMAEPTYAATLVGEGDVLAAMAPVLARHAPGGDPAAVHDVWCRGAVLDQEVAELLPRLRVDAVHLATNQDARRAARIMPVLASLDVDGAFVSCDIGACKPHPEFFAAVVDVLGVTPASCLLVDDSPGHVAGAESFGMAALLHVSPAQLTADLADRGLID